MPGENSQKEARRAALRKLKSRPLWFFMALLGLYCFPIILFKAAHGDQLEWPNRSGPNVLISYADHPWAYACIVVACALCAIGCSGIVWTYLFTKIPE